MQIMARLKGKYAAAQQRSWWLAAAIATWVLAQALLLGSCNYTQKITDGPTAVELRRYHEAVPLLKKEFEREKSRVAQGKIAFLIGESYQAQHLPAEAKAWYERAYQLQYGTEALERLSATHMQTEDYKAALASYAELGREIGSRYQFRRQMQAAQLGLDFDVARQANYAVEELPLGKGGSTYGASYAERDILLISADARVKSDDSDKAYAWTGRSFSDLYLQPLTGSEPVALVGRINGPFNEGAGALSPNGREILFTRCAPMDTEVGYCRLMWAEREGDGWSEPQIIAFQEGEYNYVQPAWSSDGLLMYFSSDRPEGIGGYDIYVSERVPPHDWSAPIRLPRTINTQNNEHWPRLRQDTLFFSSDGHTGFGGLDIFRSYPLGSEAWAAPYNLLPPLNSGGDDFAISFAPNPTPERLGIFTSNRGTGLDRIFAFGEPPPRPPAPVDTVILGAKLPEWRLTVTVVEQILTDPSNPSSRVLGKKPLEAAQLRFSGAAADAPTLQPLEPGSFGLSLEEGRDYRFVASADGYLSRDGSFSTKGMRRVKGGSDQDFELEIELSRVYTNREIALENIYYDLDKANIRADAQPTLMALARDLTLNPSLRIRLGSHTDCRGGDAYNRDLSQRRAESAVQFLIAQGIAADRLEAQGFGEDVPLTTCACSRCTEDEHQLNRRTTFTILE